MLCRTDLDAFAKAVKEMENCYVFPHGGSTRRRGTYLVGEIFDSTEEGRLIPLIFSRTAAYLCVFNSGKIEIVHNGEFIETAPDTRFQLSHTYTEDELQEVNYAQYGNTLFLVHPNHAPAQLSRVTDTNWTLADIDFVYRALTDVWYENAYIRFKINSGSTAFAVNDNFVITVAGGVVTLITDNTTTGNGTLPAGQVIVTDATVPNQTFTINVVLSTTDRQEWTVIGSVSGEMIAQWKTDNYPAAVSFYESRLYFGGSTTQPQRIWGSVTSDITNLTLGPEDTDGIDFSIASGRFDRILHLESHRTLLPLSYGGEYSVEGATGGITPSGTRVRGQTFHGTSGIKPFRSGQEVVFVERGKKKLRAINHNVIEDANEAKDLTLLAEHITGDGLRDIAFAQDPDYTAWATREDGMLLSMTYYKEQSVLAWARHPTVGLWENVAVIPEDVGDTPYLITKRTIDAQVKRFVEFMDYEEQTWTDCSLQGESVTAETTWTGFDHLEGETVDIRADGMTHRQLVVEAGIIELDYPAFNISGGLPYVGKVVLLHPEVIAEGGTAQGRNLSIYKVVLRLQDSVGLVVNGEEYPFQTFDIELDTPIPPFTGDIDVRLTGWTTPNNVEITHPYPQPFTLLGAILFLSVND